MHLPFQARNLSPMHQSIKQQARQLGLCWLHPSPHLVSESSWRDHRPQLSIHTDVLKYHLGGTQELEEMGPTLPKQTNIKTFTSSHIKAVCLITCLPLSSNLPPFRRHYNEVAESSHLPQSNRSCKSIPKCYKTNNVVPESHFEIVGLLFQVI